MTLEGEVGKASGLRAEIILNIALLMAAALVFSGFLLLKLTERELVDQRLSGITATMTTLSGSLSAQARKDSLSSEALLERARDLLSGSSSVLAVDAWAVVGPTLKPFASSEPSFTPDTDQLVQARALSEPALWVRYPASLFSFPAPHDYAAVVTVSVIRGGQFAGALQARFPLGGVRQRIEDARKLVFAYSAVFGMILVLFGVYLLNRTVLRPLNRLTETTRRVAGGDLAQRLPVEGPREVAALAQSFNTMTGALEASRRQTEATIGSLRRANAELQATRDELVRSEKMASVGRLAAGMAHEIGNPLGALVGYLELLKGEISSGACRDILGRSLAETERIDRLVRDLLDYAAPGSSQGEVLDPVEAVAAAREILEQQGALKTVRIRDDLPAALPRVCLVRHSLVQIFVNLLLNARDASPEGGTIRLAGAEEGDFVWLSVADEGEGMSPEVRASIFDPFYTTKPPGKGRGLGLSVCHRVVEEAGGRIEVASEPGQGSRFTVWLPKAGRDFPEKSKSC